ncbi:hypothetical protein [Granulicella aggregans]|nr:hypothetical protein [Granulicella aggregans]
MKAGKVRLELDPTSGDEAARYGAPGGAESGVGGTDDCGGHVQEDTG